MAAMYQKTAEDAQMAADGYIRMVMTAKTEADRVAAAEMAEEERMKQAEADQSSRTRWP